MMRALRITGLALCALFIALVLYGAKGYWDAVSDVPQLTKRADDLIAHGKGGASLGKKHLAILLRVEDPNFVNHGGLDFSTPGAGATTITQSASKRLAFKKFHPGIEKIRQSGYALGLESRLSKEQILALWLDTLEMGRGPKGWMTGFHNASHEIYGRPPAALTDQEFIRLVAVLIAPDKYRLEGSDLALDERVRRIERLAAGACAPDGHDDVLLAECSALSQTKQ